MLRPGLECSDRASQGNQTAVARGDAEIPGLLRQLASLPASRGKAEPWFSLWSSLAHQGDVYSASFAAVPHVVHALSTAPERADASFFQFPTWVEICRQKTRTPENRSHDRD